MARGTRTEHDNRLLTEIIHEQDSRKRAVLICLYYQDEKRAERTPKQIWYFHLGLLAGAIFRITERYP